MAVVLAGAFVVMLIIAEPSDRASSTVFFRGCAPEEEAHLAEVHAALIENNRLLGSFDGLKAVSGGSELDLNMDLQKPWPMRLTCVTSDECVNGVVPPGSIGVASIELDICDYKGPGADLCDSFAALAYGHARARRVVPERAERYFEFIRGSCADRF